MSGGSWDYVYSRIDDIADRLLCSSTRTSCTDERRALGRVLKLAAAAMHDIEWVDSCDYSDGDEREAIMKVVSRAEVVEAAADRLRAEIDRAQMALERLGQSRKESDK